MIGYVLLAGGILMIVIPIFFIAAVLTGKNKPPQVFNVEAPEINLPSQQSIDLPDNLKRAGVTLNAPVQGNSKMKLIPDAVFNDTLNIGLYYLLMTFIASSGSKIAGIGVKLIKDIKVQVKG